MTARLRGALRNPLRCPLCFRIMGASRHGMMPFHKSMGKKCTGIGCYGGEVRGDEGHDLTAERLANGNLDGTDEGTT